ncbi:MAG TPA: tetratricopeptide repeat protein [Terriglobales bacterium]|jgi:tetratricopeptide (TPR) repeat protein|nr:tetratricopeptide repeat protein [Terriglobales bacterium]
MKKLFGQRSLLWQLVFLFLSAVYLFAFPQPNLIYPIFVLLHMIVGVIATVILLALLARLLRDAGGVLRLGWLLLLSGGLLGCVLIYTGTVHSEFLLLYTHIILCVAGIGIVFAEWAGKRGWMGSSAGSSFARVAICFALLAGLSYGSWYFRHARWLNSARIENPDDSPASMDGEGDGPKGAFFPSSAQVYGNQKIPSKFFMESDSCKRCHQDIYNEWNSSAHHFSSFDNQWYRKSIEYMQDTIGTKPSKWCGGCHDPAVLYAGKMDTPIKTFVHSPEAQAGMGCMMCHSIARVKSTMGQADFFLEYPKLHELAASKNPFVRTMHDFLVYLNPEPHRRVFLKPFMRNQTAEFCSACHKVHLDVPVNDYRWVRGFNEYDNWQASGVSGQGARSFYYPPKPMQCADCHMPLTKSADQGNVNGFVHSHRFPGANTALPTANDDMVQLKTVEDFLKAGALTVDIFALSPEQMQAKSVAVNQSDTNTTFAVGEEAESKITSATTGEVAPVTAPLSRVHAAVRRGDTVRVDVVVRTKTVGHFFPGGTVDAYDTWLELKATDDKGQTIFWSGMVEDNGHGPVEPGAHFYRSLQIDEHGNPINKRNAWATRSVVYVRLIPPGAADTVHYRLHIPESAGNKITLHSRLCYRKFSWWNTQFAFAGVPGPGDVKQDYDDRPVTFDGSLKGVSAHDEKIPDLPVEVIAENEVTLDVEGHSAPRPESKIDLQAKDWQRWNDYGIGLFLQGDLKGAQAAFEKVTEIVPDNPEGWVNIGRCAVQEGDMDQARTVLTKALSINPKLAKTHYFYARVLRSDGNYEGSAQQLHLVLAQYPRDRVALNDLGRILFLQRKYAEGVQVLNSVLEIDPEDLQAHYTLMLCYRGLGDEKKAQEHEKRYLRFKAQESAQAITGPYREKHPDDNNERQAIHEHVSVPLPALQTTKITARRLSAHNPIPGGAQ